MQAALRRTAAAASLVLTVTALPVALASPASATKAQCVNYLGTKGYRIGSGVKSACRTGASGSGMSRPVRYSLCVAGLERLGVRPGHASKACTYSQR